MTTTKLKPFTLQEYEDMLTRKDSEASITFVFINMKYSAAKYGIFDFPADARFYWTRAAGHEKPAKAIALERLRLLKKKKGRILSGEALDRATLIYRKAYQEWIESDEALEHPRYKKIKKWMRHYVEPVETAAIIRKKSKAQKKLSKR